MAKTDNSSKPSSNSSTSARTEKTTAADRLNSGEKTVSSGSTGARKPSTTGNGTKVAASSTSRVKQVASTTQGNSGSNGGSGSSGSGSTQRKTAQVPAKTNSDATRFRNGLSVGGPQGTSSTFVNDPENGVSFSDMLQFAYAQSPEAATRRAARSPYEEREQFAGGAPFDGPVDWDGITSAVFGGPSKTERDYATWLANSGLPPDYLLAANGPQGRGGIAGQFPVYAHGATGVPVGGIAAAVAPDGTIIGEDVDITGGIPKSDGQPVEHPGRWKPSDIPPMQMAPPELAIAAGLAPSVPANDLNRGGWWGNLPQQSMVTGGPALTKEDYIRMGIDPEAAEDMPGLMTDGEAYVPGPVPPGPGSGGDNVLGDIKTGLDGVMDGSNKPKLDFTLGWGHGNPVNIDNWNGDSGSSGDVNYYPPGAVPPGGVVPPFPDVNHNGIDDRLEGIGGLGAFAANRQAVFPTMPPYNPGIDNEWTYFRPGMARGGIVGYADGGQVSPLAQQDPRVEIIANAEDALHNAIEGTPEADDKADIQKFVETFGEDALQKLQANVAGGMKMRQKGDGRMVQGPGGPTDDAVPAVVDGEQPVALSNGEFVMSKDAVDGVGGPDAMQQLHDKLAGMKQAA